MTVNMHEDLSLEDLATISGLSLRTLRFYIQEGLLQGPDTRGKNARYSYQHLDRIKLIQRLKNLRLPLQEIRHLINNMSPDEITRVRQLQDSLHSGMQTSKTRLSGTNPSTMQVSSALEYIRNLEQGRLEIQAISEPFTPMSPAQPSSASTPEPASEFAPLKLSERTQGSRSQEHWTRIILVDGLELNVRQPGEYDDPAKLEELLSYARQLFGIRSKKGE